MVRIIPGIPSNDGEVPLSGFMPTFVSLQPGTSLNAVHFAVQDGANARIDGDGNRKVPGVVDGMVQDPFRFRWVSTNQQTLYRLSGGRIVTLEGESNPGLTLPRLTAGLTVDDRGYVWTGSNPSLRIEPHGATWEEVPHSGAGRPFAYAGEVWFAGNPVHAVSMDPPFVERRVEGFSAEVVRATLGYVFALSEGEVYEIDPVTLATTPQRVPEGFGPVGALTSDGTGRFVALDGSKNIAIYDVTIGRWAVHPWSGSDDAFPNDPDLIDGTRDVPAWGLAVQEVDLDRDPVALDWYQETPGQSRVEVHVTFAESAEAMPASRTTCLFTEPPAEVAACSGGKRHARVEFMLLPGGEDRPKIGDVTWFGYR